MQLSYGCVGAPLNDGLGVRNAGILFDFSITGAGGPVSVSLNGATTVGDVISKINAAGQTAGISAAVSSDGTGITLTDSGGGPVTVASLNASLAANDLGILGSSASGTLTGDRIASGLQGPLLKNLNGGWQGQAAQSYRQLQDRWNSDAKKMNDILNDIKEAVDSTRSNYSASEEQQNSEISKIMSDFG